MEPSATASSLRRAVIKALRTLSVVRCPQLQKHGAWSIRRDERDERSGETGITGFQNPKSEIRNFVALRLAP
jgi:hypothetical protein